MTGEEETRLHQLELRAALRHLLQRGRHIGLLHEAIFQHDPEKTAPQILKLVTAILFHKRLVENPDGEQDHPLVQHLVVLQVMKQRSEEHTSELQSLMRISYARFCLKKNKTTP